MPRPDDVVLPQGLTARFVALRNAGWTDAQVKTLQRALQPEDQEPRSALAEFARGRPLTGKTLEEISTCSTEKPCGDSAGS